MTRWRDGCRRWLGGWLLIGAMGVQLGPTTTQQAVEQMNRSSMRGIPAPPARAVPRSGMVWVPDQYVRVSGHVEALHVPGHWVPVTPQGEVVTPPLTATEPGRDAVRTIPPDAAKTMTPESP
jgi:hypothetical protein